MDISDKSAQVSDLVRTFDRDRYLAGLFAPQHARDALMALFAFNCELDRIPALVSEPALGEIRLQWWRDVIDNAEAQQVTGNPVADTLIKVISAYALPKALLLGMIDARSADLDGGGFADLTALKAYLYKTHGAVFSLATVILSKNDKSTVRIINPAAEAYGMMRVLRRLPYDAAAGRVMLPLSLLGENGSSPEDVLSGEDNGIRNIILEMSLGIREVLAKCRQGLVTVPRNVRPAFTPLAVVEPNLRALEKTGVRPLQEVTEINPLLQFFRIWRCSRTGCI